jgi:manganese transport protein
MAGIFKQEEVSLSNVHETIDTTKHTKGWKRVLAYIGPAYLVSVGYMDPGNWATDLQGGAQFGYKLIWVLLMSNLMAILLQNLSARLGIVRRRDLAQANREVYPPVINFCLYILAELAIAACDLAEILGMAIGIHLLSGLPILWGVLLTVFDTFILLVLQRYGMRKMEAFIISLVAIIGLSFIIELILSKPVFGDVIKGVVPSSLNKEALYIAVGIIGATVMPHNLYLHSALVQTRKIKADDGGIKQSIRFNKIDSAIALNVAFLVNAAILILAASAFFVSGHTEVAKIEDAYKLLSPQLGSKLAPLLFAIALIASGQSSTVTGTLAGQIVMEGYLSLRISPWIRRLLTRLIAITPAVIVIAVYGDEKIDDLIVFSQVILSLQLSFAIIPLIHFVSDKKTMGKFAIKGSTQVLSWIVAAVLVFLNTKLVFESLLSEFTKQDNTIEKICIIIAVAIFIWLFISMSVLPLIQRRRQRKNVMIHAAEKPLQQLNIPQSKLIAITLDFSKNDEKVISYALSQGKKESSYLLIHIVETASANYLGKSSDDYETRTDIQRLYQYAEELMHLGYRSETKIGYHSRVTEIVRIVKESGADMLVMGAHRHTGLKDVLFGETVEQVRHKLTIPILIV